MSSIRSLLTLYAFFAVCIPTSKSLQFPTAPQLLPSTYTPTGKPSSSSANLNAFLTFLQETLLTPGSSNEPVGESDFISAGRSLMAITRFQEIPSPTSSSLSAVCFEEISLLHNAGVSDTGCLMVLPELDLGVELDDWFKTNIAVPLDSLGVSDAFTVTTYSDGNVEGPKSPHQAIRIIHRLTDAPIMGGGDNNMTPDDVDRKVDEMYERAERQVKEKRRIEREKKERKEKKKGILKNRKGGDGFGGKF